MGSGYRRGRLSAIGRPAIGSRVDRWMVVVGVRVVKCYRRRAARVWGELTVTANRLRLTLTTNGVPGWRRLVRVFGLDFGIILPKRETKTKPSIGWVSTILTDNCCPNCFEGLCPCLLLVSFKASLLNIPLPVALALALSNTHTLKFRIVHSHIHTHR